MTRVASHPVDPLFLERWSPRAMSGEPLAPADLDSLFEAARWAPSSGNGQPWRFVYAINGSPAFKTFFDLLASGNQAWCVKAGALVVVVSAKLRSNGTPARTHSFDTGAAWMSFALQGSRMGLVVHGMEGFDYDAARSRLGIPDDHAVEAMIAVGKPGSIDDLPEPYRPREVPSDRQAVESFVFEGAFRAPE